MALSGLICAHSYPGPFWWFPRSSKGGGGRRRLGRGQARKTASAKPVVDVQTDVHEGPSSRSDLLVLLLVVAHLILYLGFCVVHKLRKA